MTTEPPLTFTDAESNICFLHTYAQRPKPRDGLTPPGQRRNATIPDVIAALSPRGYAVVPVLGTEPTDEDLRKLESDIWRNQSILARRAIYLAGSASRQAEIDELRGEHDEWKERARDAEGKLEEICELVGPGGDESAFGRVESLLSERRATEERLRASERAAQERATTAEARVVELEAELARSQKMLDICGAVHGHNVRLKSDRDEARTKLAALEAQLSPENDATDAAHPAWWRGHDAGTRGMTGLAEKLKAKLVECERLLAASEQGRVDAECSFKHTEKLLVECERQRDHAHDSAEELLAVNERLRSRLEKQRAVVEPILELAAVFPPGRDREYCGYNPGTLVRQALDAADALASAGGSSQDIGKGGSGSVESATREDAGEATDGASFWSSTQPEPPAPAQLEHNWYRGLDGAYHSHDWTCGRCGAGVDGAEPSAAGCPGRAAPKPETAEALSEGEVDVRHACPHDGDSWTCPDCQHGADR
jgi:hypothetical protein